MTRFSLRDSLIKLKEKNYDPFIGKTIDALTTNLNEDQLRVLLMSHGLKIDNRIINLYFYDNVGFRCMNEREDLYGKKPICNNIERFMNQLYENSFQQEFKDIWNVGDIMIFNFSHEEVGVIIAKLEEIGTIIKFGTEPFYNFKGFKISPENEKGQRYDFSYTEDDLEVLEIGEHSLMFPTDEQIKEYFPEEWKKSHTDRFDL